MNTLSQLKKALLSASILGALTLPMAAQSNPDAGSCAFPPTAITNLLVEYKRGLADLSSTLNPGPFPADLFAILTDPKNEIHDRITYDSATNQFRNIIFWIPAGSPIPTPSTYDFASRTFLFIDVNVDKIYMNCKPYASAMFVGVIRRGVPLLGDPKGYPYMFSFGYNTATKDPGKLFRDIGSNSGGLGNQYKNYGGGSITVANWPGETQPAPTNAGPPVTAAVVGGNTVETLYRQIVLDGSASTGGALTYSWSGSGVAILDPTASNTRIQIVGGYGEYPVTLTVSNTAGQQSTATVLVRYLGR